MIRFLITTHGHLPGVRLSQLGPLGWGNVPFRDEAAAIDAAKWHGGGQPIRIERKAFPALPDTRQANARGL